MRDSVHPARLGIGGADRHGTPGGHASVPPAAASSSLATSAATSTRPIRSSSAKGDDEEVCDVGDGIRPGVVCLAGAQTFEAVESQR